MSGVPANIIVPFVGVEFDSSRANVGTGTQPIKSLLIGQKIAAGTATADTKYSVFNADEAATLFGRGSVCHRMAIYHFLANPSVPVTMIGLADADGSGAATHAFTVSGTATGAGEIAVYVAGERYAISVAIDDTPTDIADAIVAAITADLNIQVTAANTAGVVTLTCRNKGIAAGDLDVRFNANAGEVYPLSVSIGSVTTTPGTVDPDVSDALAAIGDDWFNVITSPYYDSTNMDAIETYLETQDGPMVQRTSVCYQAKRDTLSNMITFGEDTANRNSPHMVTLPSYKRFESTYELASSVSGVTAVSIQDDPARPLHRITLPGLKVVDPNDRWTTTERNTLAKAGIATLTDELGVQTESTVTMYLKNSAGGDDTAYQFQNTVFVLSALRYRFVNQILTRFPRAKLTNNIEGLSAGQQVMTPGIGRTEAVAWFKAAQRDGLVEGGSDALDQFKDELRVERNEDNVNRLDWILPPDLINQFIVGSGLMQFRQ